MGLHQCSAMNKPPTDTIASLQAGRGVAALAVVLLHSALAARNFGGPFPAFALLSHGYIGVDYFFVLSGFIIYHSTIDRRRGLARYFSARFKRVYLPYWPVGIAIGLVYLMQPAMVGAHRDWSWLSTLTLVPIDRPPALSVAWTLQHEILFYGLFGLFYFSGLLPLGTIAWAICIVAIRKHVLFDPVNLEFLFGMLAAVLYRARQARPALALMAPILFAVWIWAGADETTRVLIGAALACLVAPLAQAERNGIKIPRPLILLGAASYSLYLVHTPIISIVERLLDQSWAILAAGIVSSLITAWLYQTLVEARVVARKTNPEVFADQEENRRRVNR
jgi:peptidoglycan/LPS O-acetylase OafA/YrhL